MSFSSRKKRRVFGFSVHFEDVYCRLGVSNEITSWRSFYLVKFVLLCLKCS